MLDLWLIRHGESLGNLDGSEADTALSPRGRLQAGALATAFAGHRFDRVLSSPLQRARETAALALPDHPVELHPDLRELIVQRERFIDASKLSVSELLALAHPPDEPLVETGKQFMARVRNFLTALPPTGGVVAFTHAGVIREALRALLPDLPRQQPVGQATICRFSIAQGVTRIVALDDRRHLDIGPSASR